MKVKIKRKEAAAPLTYEVGSSVFQAVNKFLEECRYIDNPSRLGTFLAGKHREVFNEEVPNAMLCLIQSKIAHRMQYLGMVKFGKEMSKSFLKNYEASQRLDVSGYEGDLKFFMEQGIKQEIDKQGEGTMAKVKMKAEKKEAATPKEKKLRPGAVFVELFANNAKAKLSDEKISAEIVKRCAGAKKYSVAEVRGYRNGYNNGKLTGQKGKPGVKSVTYDKE